MDEFASILWSLDSTIQYILVAIALISLLVWFGRDLIGISKNRVFDFVLLGTLCGFVGSRIIHIVLNSNHYLDRIWRVYPYFLGENDELVWFYDQPWVYLQIWDGGFHFFGLFVGVFIAILLFPLLFNLNRKKISLLVLVLPFLLIATRVYNLFILYQDKNIEMFFSPVSIVNAWSEILVGSGIILLFIFLRKRSYKYLWVISNILFWIGIALTTIMYDYPPVIGSLNPFTLFALLILFLYFAPFILYMRIPQVRKKSFQSKRGHLSLEQPSWEGKKDIETYSLSFKDIESKGSSSNISQKFYALKRKIVKLFKK